MPNLLYRTEYEINESIHIVIPKVGEVLDNEDTYYSIVAILTAMPIDFMVQLDDAGIDFTEINEYELFLIFFSALKELDTHLVFGDLDLTKFVTAVNKQNNTVVLWDKENNIVIDRAIHDKIATALREIHHLEKNYRKPANNEAKTYIIERERMKQKRRKNRQQESQIEPLIIALVNTKEYKYDYETTRNLSIYQFNESMRQVIRRINYDNVMHGVYAGTINAKEMNPDDLSWLVYK